MLFSPFQNIVFETGVKLEMQTACEKHKGGKRKSIYAFVTIGSFCQGPTPRPLTLICVHLITHYIKSRRCISFSYAFLFFISRF